MMLLIKLSVLGLFSAVSSTGEFCVRQWHCNEGTFCYQNVCRKNSCIKQSDCQADEMCLYGNIGSMYREACFPFTPSSDNKDSSKTEHKADLCPGGGNAIRLSNGRMEQCDLNKACVKGICNPQNGVCCTKIRTCLSPARPLINLLINKPIICKVFNEVMIACPEGTFCEEHTGFCCGVESTMLPTPSPMRPRVGTACDPNEGCMGNAACICELPNKCMCQCPAELGYTLDVDGIYCKRVRRRLQEKCKTNAECQAAYSECTSGGCRCKIGFQRDRNGGCKPIAYRCANKLEPLKKGKKIRTCKLQLRQEIDTIHDILHSNDTELYSDASTLVLKEGFRDDCPERYYCVPTFDHPKAKTFQGFCCPLPSDNHPVCPVGVAHETSSAPDYGCQNCPDDYFCHRDKIYTKKELGESCQVSEQCMNEDDGRGGDIECDHGICKCPYGYADIGGSCKRVSCTVGWKGEPSVDSNNRLIHCIRSSDCATGYMCDLLFNVCCKGVNRCPKGFTEVVGSCSDGSCIRNGDFCHRPPKEKEKLCCREEMKTSF